MVIWISVILGLMIVMFFSYFKSTRNQTVYPPGPTGIPFIGNIAMLKPIRCIAFKELGKTYGDVFTVNLLSNNFIVLNSIEAIRSALIENGKIFTLRRRFKRSTYSAAKAKGLLFSDGGYWKDHRRFILKTLRDFGFAKAASTNAIHTELQSMIEFIDSQKGEPISTGIPFAKMTANVISRMAFGQRLSEDDDNYTFLLSELIFFLQASQSVRYNLFNFLPFLVHIPFLEVLYNKFNPHPRSMWRVLHRIRELIRQHFNTLGDISEPRDLTDALILHKLALDSQNTSHTFDEEAMMFDLFDLFIAGTDTTSVTLSWGILLMAINPEVQDKTRLEIHKHLGTESFPTIQDRSKFNYALAVVDEIQRFSSIVPSSLMHRASEEVNICGRTIPKDAIVIPNLYSVHYDPRLWKYPESFNPDNFLDDEGVYKASDNLIQFSLGKRACAGESLARMEVFTFFVGLMQKYQVSLHDHENVDLAKLLTGVDGIIRHLEDHKIRFHGDHLYQ